MGDKLFDIPEGWEQVTPLQRTLIVHPTEFKIYDGDKLIHHFIFVTDFVHFRVFDRVTGEFKKHRKLRKQKMFKDMATNGYPKLMPVIASGMSQTEFLSLNEYEEKILKLGERLVPVQSSNTQSSKTATETGKEIGAPKKEEDELAEKTIQNQESQS